MPLLSKNPKELTHADVLEWQFDGWMSDWRPGERIAISRPKWPCGCSVFVACVAILACGFLVNNLGYSWLLVVVGGLLGGVTMFRWWHGPWSHIVMDFGQDLLQVNASFSRQKHSLSSVHRLRITTKKLPTGDDAPERYSATLLALTDVESIPLGTTYVEGSEAKNAISLIPMAATLAICLEIRFDVPDHLESSIIELTEGALDSLKVSDRQQGGNDSDDLEEDDLEEDDLEEDDDDDDLEDDDADEQETLQGQFGIDEWSPGTKVRTRTDGSRWRDLIVVIMISFAGSLVGIGLLIYAYKSIVGPISETLSASLHLILANLASCFFVWRAYKPATDVELDWDKRTIEVLGGLQQHRTYTFDEIDELQLSGFVTNKETMREQGRHWPYPPRWQIFLHLVVAEHSLPLLIGTTFTGSLKADGTAYLEDAETPQLAYDELLHPTMILAAELDVDWRWIGYTGDDSFQP